MLLDVDTDEGTVSLMTDAGETKDDVNLARDEHGDSEIPRSLHL